MANCLLSGDGRLVLLKLKFIAELTGIDAQSDTPDKDLRNRRPVMNSTPAGLKRKFALPQFYYSNYVSAIIGTFALLADDKCASLLAFNDYVSL